MALILFACFAPLQAATIPTLYNTGVNDAGELLEPEQPDPHYTITVSPDFNFPGPEAFALLPGFPVPPWVEEGPLSRWIAPQADQSTGNEPGTYTYQTTFDLTGFDPTTAQITGQLATDDGLAAVRLNGETLSGITSPGFTQFTAFTIPRGSPFTDGINTLEFDISNGGTAANPTGLRIEMTGIATGANEAPSILEPPQGQTVIVGDQVTFTVDALGSPPLAYQWRFNGEPIDDATEPAYTITGVTTNNTGNYSVTVSNSAGETNSVDAVLTVLIPFPGIYNTGVDSNRALLEDGAEDPHYRLVVNANDPSSTVAVAQTTIPVPPWLTNSAKSRWIGPQADATALGGEYVYQLLLDLTGYDPATAFLAGDWATDDGGSLFLNGADTGFRSPSFTAFSSFMITNGFVSGTNVLEFRIVNGGENPTGLRVENLRGTATEGAAAEAPPRIVVQPQGGTRVITEEITFTVVADGTPPLSYQWLHNSAPIEGATNAALTLSPIRIGDAGAYSVQVSNALGTTNSAVVELNVIQPELGVFNTGVDSTGAALPIGEPDPHYVLITSPDSDFPGPTTFATAGPIPPWFENDENSQWIAPRPDGGANVAPGSYTYRLIFTIAESEVETASILANVGTDDGNGGVFLNGVPVEFGSSGFGGLTPLEIPAGSPFVAGINTLDFVAVNGGAAANPSGLRVDDIEIFGVTVLPRLAIAVSEGQIRLAWPVTAEGFVLQETAALPGGWQNSSATVTVEGNQNVVILAPGEGTRFFRLAQSP